MFKLKCYALHWKHSVCRLSFFDMLVCVVQLLSQYCLPSLMLVLSQLLEIVIDSHWKQGSSGHRRPHRPGSLKPSLVPKVVTDVLVFVQGLPGWWVTIWDTEEESQYENKEFENPGRRERRRPAEAWLKEHAKFDMLFFAYIGLAFGSGNFKEYLIERSLQIPNQKSRKSEILKF